MEASEIDYPSSQRQLMPKSKEQPSSRTIWIEKSIPASELYSSNKVMSQSHTRNNSPIENGVNKGPRMVMHTPTKSFSHQNES